MILLWKGKELGGGKKKSQSNCLHSFSPWCCSWQGVSALCFQGNCAGTLWRRGCCQRLGSVQGKVQSHQHIHRTDEIGMEQQNLGCDTGRKQRAAGSPQVIPPAGGSSPPQNVQLFLLPSLFPKDSPGRCFAPKRDLWMSFVRAVQVQLSAGATPKRVAEVTAFPLHPGGKTLC